MELPAVLECERTESVSERKSCERARFRSIGESFEREQLGRRVLDPKSIVGQALRCQTASQFISTVAFPNSAAINFSFQKRFLFVHIPKTAGNSIQSVCVIILKDELWLYGVNRTGNRALWTSQSDHQN